MPPLPVIKERLDSLHIPRDEESINMVSWWIYSGRVLLSLDKNKKVYCFIIEPDRSVTSMVELINLVNAQKQT